MSASRQKLYWNLKPWRSLHSSQSSTVWRRFVKNSCNFSSRSRTQQVLDWFGRRVCVCCLGFLELGGVLSWWIYYALPETAGWHGRQVEMLEMLNTQVNCLIRNTPHTSNLYWFVEQELFIVQVWVLRYYFGYISLLVCAWLDFIHFKTKTRISPNWCYLFVNVCCMKMPCGVNFFIDFIYFFESLFPI